MGTDSKIENNEKYLMNVLGHSDVISDSYMDVNGFYRKSSIYEMLGQIHDENLSNRYEHISDNGFTENQILDLVSEHPIRLGSPRQRSPQM